MSDFLIDTSVWIDFFTGTSPGTGEMVVELLDNNRIYYNGVILSELLMGAHGKKKTAYIRENFAGLKYLETDEEFFVHCAEIAKVLKRKDILLSLSDLMIAAHVKLNRLILLTQEELFQSVCPIIGLRCELLNCGSN